VSKVGQGFRGDKVLSFLPILECELFESRSSLAYLCDCRKGEDDGKYSETKSQIHVKDAKFRLGGSIRDIP